MVEQAPMSIVTRAYLVYGNVTLEKGLLIERIEVRIRTAELIYDAIDEHNAEAGNLPTRITWRARMLASSPAHMAIRALQATQSFFELWLAAMNTTNPQALKNSAYPVALTKCKVTDSGLTAVSDDFPMVEVSGIALRGAFGPPGKQTIIGSDIPQDEELDFSLYVPT